MVRQVLKGMASGSAPAESAPAPQRPETSDGRVTAKDYPLGTNRPDLIRSPTGKKLDELTLDAVVKDVATFKDFTITPEALELQAQVAESAGRPQIGPTLNTSRPSAPMARIETTQTSRPRPGPKCRNTGIPRA